MRLYKHTMPIRRLLCVHHSNNQFLATNPETLIQCLATLKGHGYWAMREVKLRLV